MSRKNTKGTILAIDMGNTNIVPLVFFLDINYTSLI